MPFSLKAPLLRSTMSDAVYLKPNVLAEPLYSGVPDTPRRSRDIVVERLYGEKEIAIA